MTITDSETFDVVIIGAGINGAGLFRELALQGLKVLLLDKGDICCGASAAPSRLIHGGIKYLETGEFRLVAQSTFERNLLLRNAPHTVRPLLTVLPIRSWFGGIVPSVLRFFRRKAKMTDRGVLITELGLLLYDAFGSRARKMPLHRMKIGRFFRRTWPHMAPDVIAAGQYYDAAITSPERLGFECVRDGLDVSPTSAVATYTTVESAADGVLKLRDVLTGEERSVRAGLIVNAGGAWIDRINAAIGLSTHYIGGTKGSHLVLDHPALLQELDGRMVYFGTPDGRICLAYPFLGHVLVGSTDIPVDDPDRVTCTLAEESYMLRMLAALFPSFDINAGQVLYRYAGVRPLPAADVDDPGAISRDHIVHEDRLGVISVLSLVGGKWTTFRGLSEEVADKVLERLSRTRITTTRDRPIGGGRNYPASSEQAAYIATLARENVVPTVRAAQVFDRYGTTARAILAFCAAGPDAPLHTVPDCTRRELAYLASHEQVRTLSDLLYRRTTIALSGRLSEASVREVAEAVQETMGWDDDRRDAEWQAALSQPLGQPVSHALHACHENDQHTHDRQHDGSVETLIAIADGEAS